MASDRSARRTSSGQLSLFDLEFPPDDAGHPAQEANRDEPLRPTGSGPQPQAPPGRLFADPRSGGVLRRGGGTLAAQISTARDEILGPRRPGEDIEAYRLRSYQALATAEETVLADHHLFHPEEPTATDDTTPEGEDPEDDPDLARRYRLLDEINRAINQPL